MHQGAESTHGFMARHATVPDAIEGFKSESDLAAALRRQKYLRWGLAALGVVVLSASAVVGLRGGGASNASIQIQSKPVGIQVAHQWRGARPDPARAVAGARHLRRRARRRRFRRTTPGRAGRRREEFSPVRGPRQPGGGRCGIRHRRHLRAVGHHRTGRRRHQHRWRRSRNGADPRGTSLRRRPSARGQESGCGLPARRDLAEPARRPPSSSALPSRRRPRGG